MACNKRGPRHHIRILITKLIRLLTKTATLPWRCAPAEYLNLPKEMACWASVPWEFLVQVAKPLAAAFGRICPHVCVQRVFEAGCEILPNWANGAIVLAPLRTSHWTNHDHLPLGLTPTTGAWSLHNIPVPLERKPG